VSVYRTFFLLLAAAVLSGCATRRGVVISRQEMEALPDDTPWHRTVYLGGVPVKFEFEKTSKGNGMLQFPGGAVRNYDDHDDGIIFQPFALDTRLTDHGDLEFSGVGVHHDDSGREVERRSVHAIFHFEPSIGKFVSVVSDPWIYAETE
jgi:hypothetical protein